VPLELRLVQRAAVQAAQRHHALRRAAVHLGRQLAHHHTAARVHALLAHQLRGAGSPGSGPGSTPCPTPPHQLTPALCGACGSLGGRSGAHWRRDSAALCMRELVCNVRREWRRGQLPQTQPYAGRGRAWCTMKCRASPTSGGREARRTASPTATVRAPSVMRSNAVIFALKRARTDACARASQLTREGAHGAARPAAAAGPAPWVLSGVRQAPATQAPDRRRGAGGPARRARACTPSSAMPLKRMRLSSVAWQCASHSRNLRSRLPGPSAAARGAPLGAVRDRGARDRGAPQQAGGNHTGRAEAAGYARVGFQP